MDKSSVEEQIRVAVVLLLKRKGYSVSDISTGSGVPKLSRLEIVRGRERLTCVVKTSKSGRISFSRETDGTYRVLSDVDRVVHAHLRSTTDVDITMFDRETVRKAFDKNWKTLQEDGKEHLPIWVNPNHEDGRRLTGSGFQEEAIWTESVPIVRIDEEPKAQDATQSADSSSGEGVMNRIKKMLSEHMGVSPDHLEVHVHVRL
jgi:hypothetical protein